jgi:uncharacterized protein
MPNTQSLHSTVGIGLRGPHVSPLIERMPAIGWLEIHSENWMSESPLLRERLDTVCAHYPLSLHGVGLSLGSSDGINPEHLHRLKKLVTRVNPVRVSDHLSWGAAGGIHSNDLLPMPLTAEAIAILVANIDQVQQTLGRPILVENISSYYAWEASCMPEWEFVARIIDRAQCGLLLDINNLYVNAHNHGFDALDYLNRVPWQSVQEVHLAGHETHETLLVDTHGCAVQPPVWALFAHSISLMPHSTPILIEWDSALPSLDILLQEAATATQYLEAGRALT